MTRPGSPGAASAARRPVSAGVLAQVLSLGQITVPLAKRRMRITALEPGADLAAIARTRLAAYPDVAVVQRRFEDYDLPAEPFDLVVSATAFRWVDREVRVTKSGAALAASPRFAPVGHRLYEQVNHYTTSSYLDLLRTFSNIRGLDAAARAGLLACLGRLIDGEFSGKLARSDTRELWLARATC